jgi:aspartate kinase
LARLVKKFGGTSIGDVDHIGNAAAKVAEARADGDDVLVVVSAMGSMTAELAARCGQVTGAPDPAEHDAVLAAGEQITAGLFAMALQAAGISSRSWAGWQLPIRTDAAHGAAGITGVETGALEQELAAGGVPVVAGFQGLGPDGRITTLGRGGSDLTAVAIAAAIEAGRCDIYTDVPGVYTADPNLVPGARKLARISYQEMLEMAAMGARVLQPGAVELASRKGVTVRVLSSFDRQPGTLLCAGPGGDSAPRVRGIACAEDMSSLALIGAGLGADPSIRQNLLDTLAKQGIAAAVSAESDVKIVAQVAPDAIKGAVRALHTAFGLDLSVRGS